MTNRFPVNHLIVLFVLWIVALITAVPAVASTTLDTAFNPVLSKAGQITVLSRW